jgi:glycosyltransferase involved in cell wall biosynthesis
MKILHIISQHPESTGSGYYIQNIIKQAQAKGHENYLIAGISGKTIPELPAISENVCRFVSFNSERLNFTIPGMSDVMPYPSSRYSELTTEQLDSYERVFGETITKAVEQFSPDIIHSHHLWIVSSVARKLFPQIPMVTSCHSTGLRQFINNPHLRPRVVGYCRKIDRILALNKDQKKKIEEIYGIKEQRIDIVGGGFNREIFYLKDKDTPPPIHIIYAGKLSFAKGVDWLLRVFKNMDDRDLHLHLAGSGTGEESQICQDLAGQCKANVTLHGKLNQHELGQLMRRCHFLVLPSFYEGLPLVLLEALSTGCRVLTTDLTGSRELLAKADEDLFEFIPLPAMKQVDRPEESDRELLEKRLQEAFMRMKTKGIKSPTPNLQAVQNVTKPYNWESVFERIELCYLSCFKR